MIQYNVYDFSTWSVRHSGNEVNENYFPISQNFALHGTKTNEEKVRTLEPLISQHTFLPHRNAICRRCI